LPLATDARIQFTQGTHQTESDLHATDALSGLSRTYKPRDEEGETYPDQTALVQLTVDGILSDHLTRLGRWMDLEGTMAVTNQVARASVVVDDRVILEDVPGTYLIWLEKRLTELRSVITGLPTLDPSEQWVYDPNVDVWRSEATVTQRTEKVPKNHVLSEATKEHPANVQVYMQDVVVGEWTSCRFSGAIPATTRREMVERCDTLIAAVKVAREEANSTTVDDFHPSESVFAFIREG
jgi:hypothetical protein